MTKSIFDMTFKRKFSVNLYKNLRLKLGEMSFSKDWLNTERGDMYPLMRETGVFDECIRNFCYNAEASELFAAERLLGQYFPYANYDMLISEASCECGFCWRSPSEKAMTEITVYESEGNAVVKCLHYFGGTTLSYEEFPTEFDFSEKLRLIVSCLGNKFFVYLQNGKFPVFVAQTESPAMKEICKMRVFNCATVSVLCQSKSGVCGGNAVIESVEFYLDSGISQADMRPIRYEDGSPYIENGKIFFTMSSRLQENQYQTVISWIPSTCEFALEGAMFYDSGDDVWANDVAASVLYNRKEKIWQVWVAGFSTHHRLAHGTSKADLRYGINVLDVVPMDFPETPDDKAFAAKTGDEDPDFFYDEEKDKWYMAICRLVEDDSGKNYRYFMFESDKPFEGYTYVTHSLTGSETGGSFVKIAGKRYFVCGSNFDKRALYHIHTFGDFSAPKTIKCDFDDGGFRGWGTVVPVPCGNRTKYVWMTFDRHGGSSWNWSYGNIYVYESDIMNCE